MSLIQVRGRLCCTLGVTLHLRVPLLQYITGMSLVTVFKCYSVPRQGITWTKSMSPWVLTLTPKPIPPLGPACSWADNIS